MNDLCTLDSWTLVADTFTGGKSGRQAQGSGPSDEILEVVRPGKLLSDNELEAEEKLAAFSTSAWGVGSL